jgi:murein endopeptidase
LGTERGAGEIVGDIVSPAVSPRDMGSAAVKLLLDIHIWLSGPFGTDRVLQATAPVFDPTLITVDERLIE